MKAMVFAAGLGSRLRPFTLEHPKALVPVGGKPMLQRVIEKLRDAGFAEIVVNVHHFSQQIIDFLIANDNFGTSLIISDESDKLLDTGGGILKAAKWLKNDDFFLVHNVDILTNVDLMEMVKHHKESEALATLLVAQRNTSRYLLLDERNQMSGWTNLSTGEVRPKNLLMENFRKLAFGGVHVLSKEALGLLQDYASKDEPFSIMPFYINACQSHKIVGYEPHQHIMWHDIGKPDSLRAAEKEFMS